MQSGKGYHLKKQLMISVCDNTKHQRDEKLEFFTFGVTYFSSIYFEVGSHYYPTVQQGCIFPLVISKNKDSLDFLVHHHLHQSSRCQKDC